MSFVVLRVSTVRDGVKGLPRPKIVQDVLLIGSKEECRQKVDEISLNPENQSTDQIEVEVYSVKYNSQKTHTSKTFTKDNGKRRIKRNEANDLQS